MFHFPLLNPEYKYILRTVRLYDSTRVDASNGRDIFKSWSELKLELKTQTQTQAHTSTTSQANVDKSTAARRSRSMGLSPSIVHHTSTVRLMGRSHHNHNLDNPDQAHPRQHPQHIGMKRSPYSDPGPGQPQPPGYPQGQAQTQSQVAGPATSHTPDAQQQQKPSLELEQWNLVLDTIRSNLNLIVGTWGRRSRQYDEARGVMLAYLEDNLGRMRTTSGGEAMALETAGEGGRAGNGHGGTGGGRDVEMRATVERSIEELMGELKI